MNRHNLYYPDLMIVPSDIYMNDRWDARAVSKMIQSKTVDGKSPTFLYLGRREVIMLKEHLEEVFGEDSVITPNGNYYMGLNVKTIDCVSFFAVGGCKGARPSKLPLLGEWRDGGR